MLIRPLIQGVVFLAAIAAVPILQAGGQAPAPTRDYPVQPVPFTAVQLTDAFWAPRIETNRTVTIPFAFEQCERTGRVDNFVRAAKVLRGESRPAASRPATRSTTPTSTR